MQVRHYTRRNKTLLYGSIIFLFLSVNLQAYPGCCYYSKLYHNEWKAIGKYMKKYYTDAAALTKKAEKELTDTLPLIMYRSQDMLSAAAYSYIFEASSETDSKLFKQYSAMWMTTIAPKLIDSVTEGKPAIDIMYHPPRIEKSLMDFVLRTHEGAKSHGELYGNQHLSKREIVYVKKEVKQLCVNNEFEIKKLQADVTMLEMALAKYAVLSNRVIQNEKEKMR